MVDPVIGPNQIDTRADLGNDDAGKYAYWMGQDRIAEKEDKKWMRRGRMVVQRYRDERPDNFTQSHRFNILWSNVQTLKPTLYARTPKPDVQRRFLDQDDTGRLASILLERSLSYSLDMSGFDQVMEAVVEDRLLPGRGVARVLYVPHFGDEIEDDANPEFEGAEDAPVDVDSPGDAIPHGERPREVIYEEVLPSYVYWEDYAESPARTWREVSWVCYTAYMTRDELVQRFGIKGKKVNLDYTPKGGTADKDRKDHPPPDIYKKATVKEFWDKVKRRVIWIAPGTPDLILDDVDDPLNLPDFFPSPDPLLATTTTDKRVPVPDFTEYQDQANELDTLTSRIDRLTRAMKVSGVYAGAEKQALQQLIDEGTENRLIPVEDWAAFMGKGGLSEIIQWVPIKQIADTLIQLYDARDRVKQMLYEVTGIGDIMRGQTSPNETMGAQQLKANFSTRRIVPQQRAVARFARDLIRIMAAVVANQFSGQTISQITGYPQLAPVPQLPPAPPSMIPAPHPMGAPPQAGMAPSAAGPGPTGAPPVGVAGGGAPMPSNVVPMPGMAPPQMVPNPAFAQWQQAQQQMQAVQQANAQKQDQFDAAVALIQKDGVHGFRLDIEADSTIAPDEQAEKQARTEFLQQMIPLLQQVVPIAQGNPPLAVLAKEMTLFAVRGFRVARPLEESIEGAFDAIAKMPPNPKVSGDQKPQGQGQNPQVEQAKIAAQVHDTQMQAQTDAQSAQLKAQTDQLAIAQKEQQAQLQFQAAQLRAAAEQQAHQDDVAIRYGDMQQRERLANARMSGMDSRAAGGLV